MYLIGYIIDLMPKRTKKYDQSFLESLKDPKEAAAYLNVHLEGEEANAEELFLLALRDVAKARGFGDVAKNAVLGRESLYKSLSSGGNPKFSTLRSLLKAMGLKLSIAPPSLDELSDLMSEARTAAKKASGKPKDIKVAIKKIGKSS